MSEFHSNTYGRCQRVLLAAAVALLPLLPSGAGAEMADPAAVGYTVRRATAPVQVDGVVDELDWGACESIMLGGYNEGITIRQPTECRMMWDDIYLYISWHCTDTQVWSTLTTRDDTLYQQEVVEVFINPDGDRDTYLELEVNPLGALWDGFILRSGERRMGILAWNSFALKRAVWVEGTVNDPADVDSYWSVELAVPLAELVTAANIPPLPGDKWRINLYRIDVPGRNHDQAEYGAWSQVSGESYHDPDRFGEITFSAEPVR